MLAGGRGERLRPLTDELPKPMVPLAGKPLLQYLCDWLVSGGVTNIMFLAGYRWQVIRAHFGDGSPFGFQAHYSLEDTPLGRGGAIRHGLDQVSPNAHPVVVVNGDVITALPLRNLVDQFQNDLSQNPAHMATITVVPFASPYGIVDVQEDRVVAFREKAELPFWINAGIYVFSRHIQDHLPQLGDHETETFPSLAAAGQVTAYRYRGYWGSVDSFKDLRVAEEWVASRTT